MSTSETTPLTNPVPPGPSYVFPNGVSPRARRQKMRQMKWCIGFTFMAILFSALIAAIILSSDELYPPVVFFPANLTEFNVSSADIINTLADRQPLADEPVTKWALKSSASNKAAQDAALATGVRALGDREMLEENVAITPVFSAEYRHYRSLSTNALGRKLARRGYVENIATQKLAATLNYTKPAERANIGRGPVIILPDSTANFNCNFNARYRHANGICNNKQEPRLYGAAMIPYRRMLAPDYADGIWLPRQSHHSGVQLPSARNVSVSIYRPSYESDSHFTVMLAVFGQFLDHDITATAISSALDGESIDCCSAPLSEHPECFPVSVPRTDPYYSAYNVSCMNFVRSAPAPTSRFGPRQQLNQATSFIDASVVYGNTIQRQRHLRSERNGTLRMFQTRAGRQLLPLSTDLDDGCNRAEMVREGKYCFESGDDRSNENLLLTSMHLIWARNHNYLALGLQQENPHWDDDTLFEEAKKILGAQLQHIAYNEFLPILFGRDFAEKKGLLSAVDDLNAPDTYDSSVDPSIANCFASAAFRFAHSLLPSLLNVTQDNNTAEAIELHKMLFNPFSLWLDSGVDSAITTAVNTPVLRVDRFFSAELTQKLFEGETEKKYPICGLDLVSLNIQRGRDHGLPAYPVFRKHCHLPPVDTWEQMAFAVDPASLDSIKKIYSAPDDVDLYTGALSEPPLEGAIFGPLLTCLVSDQFLRLKIGDAFWYERKMGAQRFTKDQLREIYNTSLAAIICRNSDNIDNVRVHVMEQFREFSNPYVACADIAKFNFSAWNSTMMQPQLSRLLMSNSMTMPRVMQSRRLNESLSTTEKQQPSVQPSVT